MINSINSGEMRTTEGNTRSEAMNRQDSRNKGMTQTGNEKAKANIEQAEKSIQKAKNNSVNREKRLRKLKEAIAMANQETKLKSTACEFSYNDETNRIAIKVKDKDTDEVIREIPAEETLEMLARIKEQAGLMLDERL